MAANAPRQQSEQYGFIISVNVIESGTYAEAFKAAMETADAINDAIMDPVNIVVQENGEPFLQGPDGVFCEGCDGHVFPGIRWPTIVGNDGSRDWVERCDRCERYDSDDAAAQALRDIYPEDAVTEYGSARPVGSECLHPFVKVGG